MLTDQSQACTTKGAFGDFADERLKNAQNRLSTGCGKSGSVITTVVVDSPDGKGSFGIDAPVSEAADALAFKRAEHLSHCPERALVPALPTRTDPGTP